MTLASCPCCGYDLERLETIKVGHLEIVDDGAIVRWRGLGMRLTPAERLIVSLLARSAGRAVQRPALTEAIDSDGADPDNIIDILLHRIRKAFRLIEPSFDRIQCIRGSRGIRGYITWRVDTEPLAIAA